MPKHLKKEIRHLAKPSPRYQKEKIIMIVIFSLITVATLSFWLTAVFFPIKGNLIK